MGELGKSVLSLGTGGVGEKGTGGTPMRGGNRVRGRGCPHPCPHSHSRPPLPPQHLLNIAGTAGTRVLGAAVCAVGGAGNGETEAGRSCAPSAAPAPFLTAALALGGTQTAPGGTLTTLPDHRISLETGTIFVHELELELFQAAFLSESEEEDGEDGAEGSGVGGVLQGWALGGGSRTDPGGHWLTLVPGRYNSGGLYVHPS